MHWLATNSPLGKMGRQSSRPDRCGGKCAGDGCRVPLQSLFGQDSAECAEARRRLRGDPEGSLRTLQQTLGGKWQVVEGALVTGKPVMLVEAAAGA